MTRQYSLKEAEQYAKYEAPAKHGSLPSDFKDWSIANAHGWTIAHEAARYGHLPVFGPDAFNQWRLATRIGWTVAHEAASQGKLPVSFDQWDIANNEGLRVSDLASEQYIQWKIRSGFDHNDAELESTRFI
jgi:hypothetical protein